MNLKKMSVDVKNVLVVVIQGFAELVNNIQHSCLGKGFGLLKN